jgi:hypothetical protein
VLVDDYDDGLTHVKEARVGTVKKNRTGAGWQPTDTVPSRLVCLTEARRAPQLFRGRTYTSSRRLKIDLNFGNS